MNREKISTDVTIDGAKDCLRRCRAGETKGYELALMLEILYQRGIPPIDIGTTAQEVEELVAQDFKIDLENIKEDKDKDPENGLHNLMILQDFLPNTPEVDETPLFSIEYADVGATPEEIATLEEELYSTLQTEL